MECGGGGGGMGWVLILLLQSVCMSAFPSGHVILEGKTGPWQCLLCPQCLAQGLAQSKSVVVLKKNNRGLQ